MRAFLIYANTLKLFGWVKIKRKSVYDCDRILKTIAITFIIAILELACFQVDLSIVESSNEDVVYCTGDCI